MREKFQKWKDAFERKEMKVNLDKTKVMVSGSVWEVKTSKIDPCDICGKRVMQNSVSCTKCRKWIHGRCAKMKRVEHFVCSMQERNGNS